MKRLKQLIATFLFLSISVISANATHVMGADLTYKSIGLGKYEITVKMYRDCRGVSMSSIDIFVSNSSALVDTLQTVRTQIRDVSNVCSSMVKPCFPVNKYGSNKGVEEHTFVAILDFNKAPFNTSIWQNACEIKLGFGQCCRNGAITTGQANETFYSEAILNKCYGPNNSSPTFSSIPYSFLCSGQSVYHNISAFDSIDHDSLSYKLVAPYKSSGVTIPYATSNLCAKPFSATMPMTPFLLNPCGPHIPKPNLDPPQGFYLDPSNGDLIFTPNQSNEVGVFVVEVTEWRKDNNGNYHVVGKTRRDMQYWVENCPANNGPKFVTSQFSYNICAGEPVNIIIEAKDIPYMLPPPAPPVSPSSVYLSWNKSISNATLTPITVGTTSKYLFSWNPPQDLKEETQFSMVVTATDDNCPTPGITQRSFNFTVKPAALADIRATQLGCNKLRLETSPWLNQSWSNFKWEIFKAEDGKEEPFTVIENKKLITLDFENGGKYIAKMSAVNIYGCTTEYIDTFTFDYSVNLGKDTFVCDTQQVTLKAMVSGGKAGYQYQWNTNQVADTLDSLTVTVTKDTTISVIVVDSTGCVVKDEIKIFYSPTPVANLGPDTAFCGSGFTLLDAGNPLAHHIWNGLYETQTLKTYPYASLTYRVEVSICGDTARDTIKQSVYSAPNPDVLGPDTNYCSAFSVTLNAGQANTYEWYGVSSGSRTATVNQPGTYSVKIVRGVCPAVYDTIVITMDTLPVANLGSDREYCDVSYDSLDATYPNSTYLWSDSSTVSPIFYIDTTGTYWVRVSKCGVDVYDTINATFSTSPLLNLGPDLNFCDSVNVTLDAGNPGLEHLWSTADTTQTLLIDTTGVFTHKITRGACVVTDTVNISLDSIPDKNLPDTIRRCGTFSEVLDAGNPFAVNTWSTNDVANTIVVTQPGMYWVKSTQCDSTVYDTVIIIRDSMPIVNLGSDTNYCDTFSKTLSLANTGATYSWSTLDTTATITINTPGVYVGRATRGACSIADTIIITMDTSISLNLGNDIHYCDSTKLLINAGNPQAQFLWSTNSTEQSIIIDSAGEYFVSVFLCRDTLSDTINIIKDSVKFSLLLDTVVCDSVNITLNAGVSTLGYLWSNNDTTYSTHLTDTGIYWVVLKNGACRDTRSYTHVGIDSLPYIDLGRDSTYCGSIHTQLNAFYPNATYLWSNGRRTASITINNPGIYWVDVTNGCGTYRDSIKLDLMNYPSVNLGIDTVFCNTINYTLSADSGYSYLWSNNSTQRAIAVNSKGTYHVKVTNLCGVAKDTVIIGLNYNDINIPSFKAICASTGDSAKYSLPLASSYLWSTNDSTQTLSIKISGDYWVEINNACGITRDSFTVRADSTINISLGNDTVYCDTFSRVLNAIGNNAVYSWNTGDTTSTITVDSLGAYWVAASNGCGVVRDTIYILDTNTINLDLGPDTLICDDTSIMLAPNVPNASYIWSTSPGDTNAIVNIDSSGLYWVEVRVCSQTARDSINISFGISPEVNLGSDTTYNDTITSDSLDAGYLPNATYLWSNSDTVQKIPITGAGVYWVAVTNNCGTARDSITILFTYPNSIKLPELADLITIYPNPSSGLFNISFDNIKVSDLELEVVSITGKVVYSSKIHANKGGNYTEPVDISHLAAGIYYVNIKHSGNKYNLKAIVKQ